MRTCMCKQMCSFMLYGLHMPRKMTASPRRMILSIAVMLKTVSVSSVT